MNSIIFCERGKREPATPLRLAGRPCHRRLWTSVEIPEGSARTGPAGCWTAFPGRSGVGAGAVAAACCGGCKFLPPASLWSCKGPERWSLRAYPWTGPKWATAASGLPGGACTRVALGCLELRIPAAPFFVVVGGVDVAAAAGEFVGGGRVGLPVELAPWLAPLANLRPKFNGRAKMISVREEEQY